MKLLLTVDRLRSITQDCPTEKDIELSLRAHKIRYSYDTRAGFLAFRIPARSGVVLVYRTASRSALYVVRAAHAPAPAPFPFRLPVYHNDC